MDDVKHLVFNQHLRAFSWAYQVKEAGSDAPLFEAIPVGFWQNSLDVFQGEANTGQKAFTIKSRGISSFMHDVFDSETDLLGTVTQESVLSHDWVIRDASTGLFGNICRTATSREKFFGAEYQIKIDESVICTLHWKRTVWNYQTDLHYSPDITESINGALLISAALLVLAMSGGGGG